MRFLYVCSDFGIKPAGTKGASVHLREITRALCELGHEVSLLSPYEGPGSAHPVRDLLAGDACPAAEWAGALRGWLKRRELPFLIAQDIRPLLYNPWAFDRALEVLRLDPPDAIVERLSLFGYVGMDLADALGCPLLVEVNALLTEEASRYRHLELTDLAEQIESRMLQRGDAVLPVSGGLAQRLIARGVDRSNIHVVANGANLAAMDHGNGVSDVRKRWDLQDAFVIGFAGSLKRWHGVDVLWGAFERLHRKVPEARLLIVGSGPMESELRERMVGSDAGGATTLAGAVDHAEISAHLRAMDIAVAPFHAMDGFYFSPIKLFEYMAAGRCVVASRLGQIEEVITDGENGLLCPPDDVNALSEAFERLYRDSELRSRMGMQARRCIEEHYTWRRAAERIVEVTDSLNQKDAGRSPVFQDIEPTVRRLS